VLLPPPQQAHGRHGLLVSGLEADGPASGAGLYVGDVLIAANGQALVEPGVLQGLLVEALIGSPLQLQVLRATAIHDIAVIVGERAR
jgi:S1-C subfamily serine protease